MTLLDASNPNPTQSLLPCSPMIRVYGETDLPEKALKITYTMLQYGFKPLPKYLNRILEILVSHYNFVRLAFDLFRNAHRHVLSDSDAMCRKSQVNRAMDLLEDMLNKGFVPDSLTYTTLLTSLGRKKKLRESYKLLCRMKIKGYNPDIVQHNTIISRFCKEGSVHDACKVIADVQNNGCLPNVVSYRTLVGGLCDKGMLDEGNNYMKEMLSKSFSLHFAFIHGLVKGFCNVGKIEEACGVLTKLFEHGEAPHMDN
ncbi:Pentatricopeptide repeat-containing protein [Arachis hypogaea]|nr:Pentatricopeptide repeat-containing protein [Arachis hypogaea]